MREREEKEENEEKGYYCINLIIIKLLATEEKGMECIVT